MGIEKKVIIIEENPLSLSYILVVITLCKNTCKKYCKNTINVYNKSMITGFPSPAQGYEQKSINLNSILIQHPSATYFMEVASSRYVGMGIYNGDILIVDRAKKVTPNSLVVYESDGEFVLGRVFNIHSEVVITGSIVYVIHKVRES